MTDRCEPPISVEANARGARVKAANAAGRNQNRSVQGMQPAVPGGRSQNRGLFRGFTV
jgi:hypothetical protein